MGKILEFPQNVTRLPTSNDKTVSDCSTSFEEEIELNKKKEERLVQERKKSNKQITRQLKKPSQLPVT